MIKKSILISALVLIFLVKIVAQQGQIVSIPQQLTVHEGQLFQVLVKVHPGNDPVSAVDYILKYDPEVISVISVDQVEGSPLNLNIVETKIDNERGKVVYNAFKLTEPWPEDLFSLIRILALKPVNQTVLHHNREGNPKTVLAFAGKDLFKSAPDIVVRVLPPVSNTIGKPIGGTDQLKVRCNSEDQWCDIEFSIAESGNTMLKFSGSSNEIDETLYNYEAQVDNSYLFRFNKT